MRWLLTGAGGMFAADAFALLSGRGHAVVPVGRAQLDITDADAVAEAVDGFDVVLNAAAWTAVDDAETEEASAFAVNAVGPALLARAAREAGARIVQISTDYVFSGTASAPYEVGAAPGPRSAYGRTKLAGEWAVRAEHPDGHLVLRTAWLYGAGGACFPKTIARVARERGTVSVVADQVGQPTWTWDVADLAERLVSAGVLGVHHATATGQASWFEFAQVVCASAGLGASVVSPTTSAAFARPAPRPAYSVLGHSSLRAVGVEPIGDWRGRWEVASGDVLRAVTDDGEA